MAISRSVSPDRLARRRVPRIVAAIRGFRQRALRKLDPESDVAMRAEARAPRRLVMDGVAEEAWVVLQPLLGKEIKAAIQELRSEFGAFQSMDSFN